MATEVAVVPADKPPAKAPVSSVGAFLTDRDSEGVMRRCLSDLGLSDGTITHGTIDTAIENLTRHGSPAILVVDVTGIDDPMMRLQRLAEICDPKTEVIVVGDRNDIVLYRDLKAFGVAEYFFKPLVSTLVARAIGKATLSSGAATSEGYVLRTGKLVIVLGVRGGVGATTIAVNAAHFLAESRGRRVVLLDLDLQTGDAALQLDVTPSHALRESLEHPDRIDELFLERGVANVTPHLSLLASLESLADPLLAPEDGVLRLVEKLMRHYRYVVVELPVDAAIRFNKLLHLPSTLVLVSDGSLASAREVARWRARIGTNTPERSILHILNKRGGDASLPEKELMRALTKAPDLSIPYDREIAARSGLGIKAVQSSATMHRGMIDLARILTGAAAGESASLWRRIFG